MFLFKRLNSFLRRLRVRSSAPANGLHLMRLERRKLLNADFTLLAGLDLNIDNVDADLSVLESANDFEFQLDNGTWNGSDVAGQVSGSGTSTLSVNKITLNSLTNGVSIQEGSSQPRTLTFDSAAQPLDLFGPATAFEVGVEALAERSGRQAGDTTGAVCANLSGTGNRLWPVHGCSLCHLRLLSHREQLALWPGVTGRRNGDGTEWWSPACGCRCPQELCPRCVCCAHTAFGELTLSG